MKRIRTIDAETLLNTPLPPVRWIVPELLPAGLAMLAGASKSGKSWLCLWMCLQIARGGTFLGRALKPQTVLCLCLEDTFARIQSRLFALTEDDVPSNLIFQTDCDCLENGLEEQIEDFLCRHPDTALIVIDTLQKIRTDIANSAAYASDYRDMSTLKSLADRHGICILLVHHLRKQGASDPFQQISGSNGLMGAADTIWLLQRHRGMHTAKLLVTGRDTDARTLYLQQVNTIWQLMDEETAEEHEIKQVPDYLWKIADFLQSVKRWQGTVSELCAAVGITDAQPSQVSRKLAEHYYTVLAPRGIAYKTHRRAQARVVSFCCAARSDSDDDDDGNVEISPSVRDIPQTPSSPSSSSFLPINITTVPLPCAENRS